MLSMKAATFDITVFVVVEYQPWIVTTC